MSEIVYYVVVELKELMIIFDVVYIDLYDGGENYIIFFEKLFEFFNKYLSWYWFV